MYYTREYLNRRIEKLILFSECCSGTWNGSKGKNRLCYATKMLDNLLGRNIALCDAGVGIGKTYAYLVACVLMRKYSLLAEGCSPLRAASGRDIHFQHCTQKAIYRIYPFSLDSSGERDDSGPY